MKPIPIFFMKLNTEKLTAVLACLALFGLMAFSCDKSKTDEDATVDVNSVLFSLPTQIEAEAGGLVDFRVLQKKAPSQTDEFFFGSTSCRIESVSETSFSVRLPSSLVSGKYEVILRRGTKKKSFGETTLTITQQSVTDFTPDKSTTVWGFVGCDGSPVSGVTVSDGVNVVRTDSKGIYQMNSAKKWGYVFISVPSGYEVPSNGVLPCFWSKLTAASSQVERADFSLTKVESQDKYKIFFLGDMHLANRTNDVSQFKVFAKDLNSYVSSHSSEKMYAMTLGDMTWDIYWYDRNYSFPEYLKEINGDIRDLQIYHSMGNHDNNYKTLADFDAASDYVKYLGPTYYSFNIGKIHYVVLDDIDCSAYDGTTSRNYVKNLTAEQIDWLGKDLAYVSKSTPLVIVTHAQIFYPSGSTTFKIDHNRTGDTDKLFALIKDYTVHFVTGHTHVIFNATPAETSRYGGLTNCYEHNAGSVCGSWWWSGKLTSGVYIGTDGSPAGYTICDVSGTDLKWKYKATAWDESYQFRTYDLNQVSFSYDDVPLMSRNYTALTTDGFGKYVKAYPKNSNNEVLINIWNWNSKWTLKVVDENGRTLDWTKDVAYDPLHIAALSVKRFNSSSITSAPSFVTDNDIPHFFKVKAADADVDLTVTVTDESGNVYSEKMVRPKKFNVDDFKK